MNIRYQIRIVALGIAICLPAACTPAMRVLAAAPTPTRPHPIVQPVHGVAVGLEIHSTGDDKCANSEKGGKCFSEDECEAIASDIREDQATAGSSYEDQLYLSQSVADQENTAMDGGCFVMD